MPSSVLATGESEPSVPRPLTAEEEAFAQVLWRLHQEVVKASAGRLTSAGMTFAADDHDANRLAAKLTPLRQVFHDTRKKVAATPGQSHFARQNSANSVRRSFSSHAARLSFPRSDPLEPSFWITFNAICRNTARLFGPLSNRARCGQGRELRGGQVVNGPSRGPPRRFGCYAARGRGDRDNVDPACNLAGEEVDLARICATPQTTPSRRHAARSASE